MFKCIAAKSCGGEGLVCVGCGTVSLGPSVSNHIPSDAVSHPNVSNHVPSDAVSHPNVSNHVPSDQHCCKNFVSQATAKQHIHVAALSICVNTPYARLSLSC